MIHLSNLLSESRGWGKGELSILNLILLQKDILVGEGRGREILRNSSQVMWKFMLFMEGKAGHGLTCTLVFIKADCKTFRKKDRQPSWPYPLKEDSSGKMTFKNKLLTTQLQTTLVRKTPGCTGWGQRSDTDFYAQCQEGWSQKELSPVTQKAFLDVVRENPSWFFTQEQRRAGSTS